MARVEVDVSHAAISRALATLGERAGGAEVASSLRCDWESFEVQMRRRMRCRASENRSAYHCLARAGEDKVRLHLEITGVLPSREDPERRRPGAVIRVRDGRRRRRRAGGTGQRPGELRRQDGSERSDGSGGADPAIVGRGSCA